MKTKKYLKLNDIEAYRIEFRLSNRVWDRIIKWDYFAHDTLGAEGFGNYTKNDKMKFFRYSCGSLYETLDWNEKSHLRKLLNEEDYSYLLRINPASKIN